MNKPRQNYTAVTKCRSHIFFPRVVAHPCNLKGGHLRSSALPAVVDAACRGSSSPDEEERIQAQKSHRFWSHQYCQLNMTAITKRRPHLCPQRLIIRKIRMGHIHITHAAIDAAYRGPRGLNIDAELGNRQSATLQSAAAGNSSSDNGSNRQQQRLTMATPAIDGDKKQLLESITTTIFR